jgi:hypothetical protein
MILYPNDPKKLYQKILRNRNTFWKVAGYKVNIQKSEAFQ